MYGLKQAPYEWNKELDSHLRQNGFGPTSADPCVYFHHQNGLVTFIVVYVVDFTIIAHHSELTNCYGQEHWIAAKHVLCYLQGTQNLVISYN
jgi:hypothetical protein